MEAPTACLDASVKPYRLATMPRLLCDTSCSVFIGSCCADDGSVGADVCAMLGKQRHTRDVDVYGSPHVSSGG